MNTALLLKSGGETMSSTIHPRADFARSNWLSLNGEWDFEFDDSDIGLKDKWYLRKGLKSKIEVPFVYQSQASGINDSSIHEVMWYQKEIEVPSSFKKDIYLCFSAVDYKAQVWLNGHFVGEHEGGYTPFSFLITDYLENNKALVTLRVEDKVDCTQPRGKQYWKERGDRCWYTPSSGIWQSVYLEERGEVFFTSLYCTPNIDDSTVKIDFSLNRKPRADEEISFTVIKDNSEITAIRLSSKERIDTITLHIKEDDMIDETHHWSPDNPILYTLKAEIENKDCVITYFGMRKISTSNGRILLNNRDFYIRAILDQGYWQHSLLTPPSDDDIIKDIKLIKAMGFNCVRMHQKIEDPRFYYWCDRLGLALWAELPSAYSFSEEECSNLLRDMGEFITRDYNHPSIIVWVPLNESWGVRNIYSNKKQQSFALTLYNYIKYRDQSRLCDTNDGWEQVTSDLCCVHDYVKDYSGLKKNWENIDVTLSTSVQNRKIYSEGFSHSNEPLLITEFGGIALNRDMDKTNWGYSGGEESEESFLLRFKGLIQAIRENESIAGFCYTQLTDVMQEVNGLVKINREEKVALDKIREIVLS